jgi:hypothetical protein
MNSNKIARALKDPSVFKLSRNVPMFEVEPILLRKKMTVAAFHLSQVSGHTPKSRGRNLGEKIRRVKTATVEIPWRLEPNEEVERLTNFGQLPRSSCLDFENIRNEFPPSFKRKFINMRNQSFYLKHRTANVGRSSRIVRMLEKIHAVTGKKDVHKFLDDVPNVTESFKVNTINEIEFPDFEDDCQSLCYGSVQHSFECTNSVSFDAERSDNNLDGIFGPVISVSPDGFDVSKIAYLFESRNNIAVVAPPGMALEESDEDSASSAFSDMSATDDLCAFFDNTSTMELRTSPKSCSSEVYASNSYCGGDVDSCLEHHSDVGGSNGIDTHSADDEVITSTVADSNRQLELETVTERGKQEATEFVMPCKPSTGMNVSSCISEAEKVSMQPSLTPARVENLSSSFERDRYEPHEPLRQSLHETGTDGALELCADHCVVALPIQNQYASGFTRSFHLSTPPPSSDESDDSSRSSAASIIEVLGIEDIVEEEALSNKPEFFFQLPTQNSSSSSSSSEEEEEDDDDDQNEKSNEHRLLGCFKPETNVSSPPLFEVTNTIAAFARGNSQDGTARQTSMDQCLARTSLLSSSHLQFPSASYNNSLTDTPIRTKMSENKPTAQPDDLTDTPLQNPQHTEYQRKSLDSLTDTPLERNKADGKLRKRLKIALRPDRANQPEAESMEKFLAPLHSQQHAEHQRKSLDCLTDTPLERRKIVGKVRKRLRVAPGRDRTNQPEEAKSSDKFQDMEKVRKKIEQKYRCKFLDTEAYDESENSDDEEDIIKQIEEEEMSQ